MTFFFITSSKKNFFGNSSKICFRAKNERETFFSPKKLKVNIGNYDFFSLSLSFVCVRKSTSLNILAPMFYLLAHYLLI